MNIKGHIRLLGIMTALCVSLSVTPYVGADAIVYPPTLHDVVGTASHVGQSQTHTDNNGNSYILWQEWSPDGNFIENYVYFKKSFDGGLTWSAAVVLSGNEIPNFQTPHLLTCYGKNGEIYVVWYKQEYEVTAQFLQGGFWMNYSHDYGENWLANPITIIDIDNINTSTGAIKITNVSLDCDDQGRVLLKWEDTLWDTDENHLGRSRAIYSNVISTKSRQYEIFVNAHPDLNSAKFPDANMLDNDNDTVWKGKRGAAPWCIEIDFGDTRERTFDTLEIDWYGGNTGSNFDILDMTEEGFVTLGTPGPCNGKVILGGLSQDPNTSSPFISTSVIELEHYTASILGIRINQAGGNMPVISEIRVKSWD